jgi:ribonuclease HI
LNNYALFTDVSLNPKLKLGMGAYLFVPLSFLDMPLKMIYEPDIIEKLHFKKFENTSSTKLEVVTVLWALEEINKLLHDTETLNLCLFTDSQCVAGLLERRQKLEQSGFISKSSGNQHKHTALYRKFYEEHDELHFEVIKLAGHSKSYTHNTPHRIFSYIDQAVRQRFKNI